MKFMESFLANRPKVPSATSAESGLAPLAGETEMSLTEGFGGDDAFGLASMRGGGFQSLRTALLEAGSVVDPSQARVMGSRESTAEGQDVLQAAHQEPTVELITNGGRIEKVIVTCACCRRIELNCTY